MEKPSAAAQVRSGVRLAALMLFSLLIGGLFFAGVVYAFFPQDKSELLGVALLAISVPVMVVTMEKWVKPFSGVLVLAILKGGVMLTSGHLLHDRTVSVSRFDIAVLMLFFVLSLALSQTFWDRRLAVVDRIVIMAYVFLLALILGYGSSRITPTGTIDRLRPLEFVAMGVGLGCLLLGWAIHRSHGKRRRG